MREFFDGAIVGWSGTINGIPRGWVICDGTNQTPDLRSRFIFAQKQPPLQPGSVLKHDHDADSDFHFHSPLIIENDIGAGSDFLGFATAVSVSFTTDEVDSSPPYYELIFLMERKDLM